MVAPRPLIFNWCADAARFAPRLKVLDLSASDRTFDLAELAAHDVVLTTYGMLRSDGAKLREIEFDSVILDEAQAIRNSASQTAHAAKALRGTHRLALFGMPVENHLGELWSLVEFLNPALLPRSSERSGGALADPESARVAAAAVRPFLLRRTKAQVAKDLPERIEKTISCQLGATQRRIDDTLRDEVRASVQGRVDQLGLGRAGVPSGGGGSSLEERAVSQARGAAPAADGAGRGRPRDARLLAVHELPRSRGAARRAARRWCERSNPPVARRTIHDFTIRPDSTCHPCGSLLRGLRPSGRCPECSIRVVEPLYQAKLWGRSSRGEAAGATPERGSGADPARAGRPADELALGAAARPGRLRLASWHRGAGPRPAPPFDRGGAPSPDHPRSDSPGGGSCPRRRTVRSLFEVRSS